MNFIDWSDVALTAAVLVVLLAGFAFEFAGETLKGWHTISWWAHRNKWVRRAILVAVVLLFVVLLWHFHSSNIGR